MHHTVHSLPVCRQPVSNVRAVTLRASDNTNMCCLEGRDNIVAINFNVVDGKLHLSLHAAVLGGEDEKLCLGTNQLDLELLAIKLSKEEEQFQLFEVRADMPNIICLAHSTEHQPVQLTIVAHHKTKVDPKPGLLGCLQLLIVDQSVHSVTGTATLLDPIVI